LHNLWQYSRPKSTDYSARPVVQINLGHWRKGFNASKQIKARRERQGALNGDQIAVDPARSAREHGPLSAILGAE
jgi:hypothetical protein